MGEIWKPVTGCESRYEVSSEGRVRSLDFERPNPLTGGVSRQKGRILVPVDSGKGYLRVHILGKLRPVHRLVCEAFHGTSPADKPHVLHGDGDSKNNRQENLRWGTRKENERDKKEHGRNPELNKTECPQGHEYDERNTRISKKGHRFCRTCARVKKQEKRERGIPESDPRHGTKEGYLGYGCRCKPCREAHSEYYRERKLRRVA